MVKNNDIEIILDGKTTEDAAITLHGISSLTANLNFVLTGTEHRNADAAFVLAGAKPDEMHMVMKPKRQDETGIIISAHDPSASLVRYHFDRMDIEDFSLTSGKLINEITINFAHDFTEGNPKSAITKHNPLSKLLYGDAKATLDLLMVQHTRVAEKIADAVLFTSSIPEILCAFTHNVRSLYLEVGDIVSITHPAGLGEHGWQEALALIARKRIQGIRICYEISLTPSGTLYRSELLTLTQTAAAGKQGINITYEAGVATITIYADVAGYPPVEGAEVTIAGVRKVTDRNGQVRFTLDPGTYTARITASGYEDAEVTFTT